MSTDIPGDSTHGPEHSDTYRSEGEQGVGDMYPQRGPRESRITQGDYVTKIFRRAVAGGLILATLGFGTGLLVGNGCSNSKTQIINGPAVLYDQNGVRHELVSDKEEETDILEYQTPSNSARCIQENFRGFKDGKAIYLTGKKKTPAYGFAQPQEQYATKGQLEALVGALNQQSQNRNYATPQDIQQLRSTVETYNSSVQQLLSKPQIQQNFQGVTPQEQIRTPDPTPSPKPNSDNNLPSLQVNPPVPFPTGDPSPRGGPALNKTTYNSNNLVPISYR